MITQKFTTMKRLLPALFVIAASLFATASYSQVYVNAHLRLPVLPLPPIPHIHVRTTPVVVDTYAQPVVPVAPVQSYYNGYDGCANGQVIVTQPQVVYRDRVYYDRYHPEYYRGRDFYRHERREEHRRW